MDLLLDTHVFLWWDSADPQLGTAARNAIADPDNTVFVSAASVWEIAIKRQIGRIFYTASPSAAITQNGFVPLPIIPEHAEHIETLPALHKDPFDRVLVAQARLTSMTLVTADSAVAAYPVATLWAR